MEANKGLNNGQNDQKCRQNFHILSFGSKMGKSKIRKKIVTLKVFNTSLMTKYACQVSSTVYVKNLQWL